MNTLKEIGWCLAATAVIVLSVSIVSSVLLIASVVIVPVLEYVVMGG